HLRMSASEPHRNGAPLPIAPITRGISKGAFGPLRPPEGSPLGGAPAIARPLERGARNVQHTILRALAYATLALAVVLVGVPIYWMLLATFKTNQEIFISPPTWIPLAPTLDNFPGAWRQAPFGNSYVNSVIYTLV